MIEEKNYDVYIKILVGSRRQGVDIRLIFRFENPRDMISAKKLIDQKSKELIAKPIDEGIGYNISKYLSSNGIKNTFKMEVYKNDRKRV